MRLRLLLLGLAALAFTGPSSVIAELVWEQRYLEFYPPVDQKTVSAEYRFTNAGNSPVIITDTQTSCGCTTVALEKKVFQPGESGVLTLLFDVGSRKGVQLKSVSVCTNDTPAPTVLTMACYLGEKRPAGIESVLP